MGVLLAAGAVMWSIIMACAYLGWRDARNDPDLCPECFHEVGLNDRRTRCGGVDDNNGWSSHRCTCQNDYHWRYESAIDV